MKISWTAYKVVLITFVVVYGIFGSLLSAGLLDQDPSSSEPPIVKFVIGIALQICLFGFFLYAKTKGVENCHKALTPARLLPHVTLWVVTASVIYTVTLIGITYVLESTKAEYVPVLESRLEQMRKNALDKNVLIEERRENADRYHRETNKKIPFLDETGERSFLEPTEASKAYDKEFQEAQDSVDTLHRFFLFSGLTASLFAATATFLYFRNR